MRSRGSIAVLVLLSALVSGGWYVQRGLFGAERGHVNHARLYDQVLEHVESRYVESLPDSVLYKKSVDGLLRELHDPHSTFLTPERLSRLTESTRGRYAGIGVQIDVRNGWITVVSPIPGSPAAAAGIETGDRIVSIDGSSTFGWTPDEAQRALRGRPGTTVRLQVERYGVATQIPFSLARREIRFRSVQHAVLMDGGVGYVDLVVFNETAAADLQRAIDSLQRAGMRSLVLDMRGDPGGLLDQGVAVAELFLDSGQRIVSMRGRTPEVNREFVADRAQPWPALPVVLLVDSSSASAAEIVAGALQDHDRALLLGTATFGKGSAQSVFPMASGGALKLTTARWYTPSGRSIDRARPPEEEQDGGGLLDRVRRFTTPRGRTVIDAGGITPDIQIYDERLAAARQALHRALGQNLGAYLDAVAATALEVRASGGVRDVLFDITPAMRDDLRSRLARRGVTITDSAWQESLPVIDRMLGTQIARYALGGHGELLWTARQDTVMRAATALASGVRSTTDLFRRAERFVSSTED